ncbi:Alba DNA/RNA-binding-like protein [Theobroma cacao]|uniref:Alba DNA/RNA-binding-like protein n=1 Tax=Theobroma cacao TaxID=3641 RepID=A0A061ELV9_THECC|nr:Alba DNA/RNA-binding-like protein [Theobroma cacao]
MGQAISQTVAISEIIKKRIPGLHQETSISSMSITDMWELMEEGLVPYYLRLEMTRQVSLISISLSTKELNKSSPGYLAIKLHLMSSRTNISLSNSKTKCTFFLFQEKQVGEVVLKAMGQAISKMVAIAEIIKKRIPGLHQETSISSMSITDMWEPMEEGLVPLEMTCQVFLILISLSTKELNKSSPGYLGFPLHFLYGQIHCQHHTSMLRSNIVGKCFITRDQAPSHDQQNQYQSQQQQNQMHVPVTGLLKIHMDEDELMVEGEDRDGAGPVTGTIQRMVVIGIRGEEVDEAEVGAIVVGMEEAGVEGKAMVMDEDGAVAVDMVVDNRLNSGIVLM